MGSCLTLEELSREETNSDAGGSLSSLEGKWL